MGWTGWSSLTACDVLRDFALLQAQHRVLRGDLGCGGQIASRMYDGWQRHVRRPSRRRPRDHYLPGRRLRARPRPVRKNSGSPGPLRGPGALPGLAGVGWRLIRIRDRPAVTPIRPNRRRSPPGWLGWPGWIGSPGGLCPLPATHPARTLCRFRASQAGRPL